MSGSSRHTNDGSVLRPSRGVLDSAFLVLRALPYTEQSRQITSLAELTGLPRSTVLRLLRQLRRNGAVDLREDGVWLASPELAGIARSAPPLAAVRTDISRVVQQLRDGTGATVSLVLAGERTNVALEMLPGREILPIDSYAGAEMPEGTAAAIVLSSPRSRDPRRRPFSAAVDDEDLLPGLTCYARSLNLQDGTRLALQIASSARVKAERFAPQVQRASLVLERLVSMAGGARGVSPLSPGGH